MTNTSELLTAAQMQRMIDRVADGIRAIGHPDIKVPNTSSFCVERDRFNRAPGLIVSIDVGDFVLPLAVGGSRFRNCQDAELDAAADEIVQRAAELARMKDRWARRFAATREVLEAKVARDGLGMEVRGLWPMSKRVNDSLIDADAEMEADIIMLDDALRPYTRRLHAWSGRKFQGQINGYVPEQKRRLRALERLRERGAVLEIDGIAKGAIVTAQRDVNEVAVALVANCDEDTGQGGFVTLGSGQADGAAVCLRDGRILASVSMPSVGRLYGTELVLDQAIPETVVSALIGEPATKLIDHPALRGTAVIAAANVVRGTRTDVKLRTDRHDIQHVECEADREM
ncbi:hypothetical protein HZF05_03020 [Sphingomonas sp. CGMCC 1.13654]|uniref:Uncharacterized protein n=1 Tax=Sphingomonas chungangi TaxID=2683589 RepID=A0A838L3F5_9SPHN|nr:hypothetical protein [Sphingomonas chungangi]MBA2933062.1 hypothetical protein [Sphingomonas chungangi]MVW56682.1 hypothetical protein [Sphingomonas chungangi]